VNTNTSLQSDAYFKFHFTVRTLTWSSVAAYMTTVLQAVTRAEMNDITTKMWANAQRDGRPAEYRWRPLFNASKFG